MTLHERLQAARREISEHVQDVCYITLRPIDVIKSEEDIMQILGIEERIIRYRRRLPIITSIMRALGLYK